MSIANRLASIANRLAIVGLIASASAPLAANAGTFTTLFTFPGGTKGAYPYGPLTYLNGEVYGTLLAYAANYKFLGNVYKVNAKTGAYQVVHTFEGGSDGTNPENGVIYSNGLLYGTTQAGGGSGCVLDNITNGCGTIFSINPSTDVETILYEFSQDPNASNIDPGAFVQVGGTLYAPTYSGGAYGQGSVINFNPSTNVVSTLYSFTGATDGRNPNPELLYRDGLFYGTTIYGGGGCSRLGGCGVLFSVDASAGADSTIHAFVGAGGKAPLSNLVYQGGSLIGDTEGGGNPNCGRGCGVSFKVKVSSGHEKVLQTFTSRAQSYSGLAVLKGSLYETLPSGGNGNGELLQVDLKTGQQTVLYTFTGGSDGSDPVGPLMYHAGAFYGITDGGNGTVFKFVP